jgi:Mrp family chromosome partitioning ATPase
MKTSLRSSPPTLADRLKDVVQYSEVKRLADNVMLLQRQKQFRSLAVLSLFPREGKTLFTAAMALSYADAMQSRVLVVDTTTLRHPQSLILKQCIDASSPMIDLISLEEYRRGTTTNGNSNGNGSYHAAEENALKPDVVNPPVNLLVRRESDQFLIKKLADERASQYGLILLDTAPLTAKNKSNIDPMLVARMADASVLVMNPHLQSSSLDLHLKILKDPALHLMGIISNEEFAL